MKTVIHTKTETIEKIIKGCKVCYVGLVDNDMPYVLPMNFGYSDNFIYLHSAPTGRVIDIINNNNNICITFSNNHKLTFQHPEVACSYRMASNSVIAMGKVSFVEDLTEKENILNIIMEQYSDKKFKYSEPAIKNVKIWKVPIDKISCKEFGVPHDAYVGDKSVKRSY